MGTLREGRYGLLRVLPGAWKEPPNFSCALASVEPLSMAAMRSDNRETLSFLVLMGLPLCIIIITGLESRAPIRRIAVGCFRGCSWSCCLGGAGIAGGKDDDDDDGFRIKWALLALFRMAPPRRMLSKEAPPMVTRPWGCSCKWRPPAMFLLLISGMLRVLRFARTRRLRESEAPLLRFGVAGVAISSNAGRRGRGVFNSRRDIMVLRLIVVVEKDKVWTQNIMGFLFLLSLLLVWTVCGSTSVSLLLVGSSIWREGTVPSFLLVFSTTATHRARRVAGMFPLLYHSVLFLRNIKK